jgi:hypothetical protein
MRSRSPSPSAARARAKRRQSRALELRRLLRPRRAGRQSRSRRSDAGFNGYDDRRRLSAAMGKRECAVGLTRRARFVLMRASRDDDERGFMLRLFLSSASPARGLCELRQRCRHAHRGGRLPVRLPAEHRG